MCNIHCLAFGHDWLTKEIVEGKKIIDVGAADVNGSLREHCVPLGCASYLGVDIELTSHVDEVCDVYDLISKYGCESFDIVISTEMLEHVEYWGSAIRNLKNICREGGYILITTRSKGFYVHGYPEDYWRYSVEDMVKIFSDFEMIKIAADPQEPGVFVFVRKPLNYKFDPNCYKVKLFAIERKES